MRFILLVYLWCKNICFETEAAMLNKMLGTEEGGF